MMNRVMTLGAVVFFLVVTLSCDSIGSKKAGQWEVHDMNRPQPMVITPGTTVGQPPSDAIILFDGSDLSQWLGKKNLPAQWKVENGYMEIVPKTGSLNTKQSFGDCQLHIEWAAPQVVEGHGQERGNSGVFLMGLYEIQVMDSYQNPTYPDGQAGAAYGQNPPLVNACRQPGQWQSYDIVFRRPRFDSKGKLIRPARVTVFQNGVLVQDNFEIQGATAHKKRAQYSAHADKLPLNLQDHGDLVRYRHIWIRELQEQQ